MTNYGKEIEERKVYDELISILRRHTKYPELLINAKPEAHLIHDLKVKSIRLVDVFLACEDSYGIIINDEEADRLRTIGEVVEAIEKKISEKNNGVTHI